jgi:hypothetical protein
MRSSLFLLIVSVFLACGKSPNEEPIIENDPLVPGDTLETSPCDDHWDNFLGDYLYYTDDDPQPKGFTFKADTTEGYFYTLGINGIFYPAASLSGHLDGCDIIIREYENVKHQGLPSNGGYSRYYYDSLKGYGQYFPDQDSILLYIEFERTGDWCDEFTGNLYLKKH